MNENITKNIVFTFIITAASTILSFVINKYILVFFGEEDLGLFRLLSQVIFYLALLDLGVSTSATVAYYKPLISNDVKKISSIFSTINDFYNKVSILTFIIGVGVTPFLYSMIVYKSKNMLCVYWMVFVMNTVITFITNKYIILYLADKKVFYVKAVTGCATLFEKVLQLSVLFIYQSFLVFLCVSTFICIIKVYIFKFKLKNDYKYIKIVSERDGNIKSNAGNMFFHKLSHIVLYNTDNVIIVKFISLTAVAAYSSYLMLVSIVMTIVSIFHSVVDPVVGHLIVKQNAYENYKLWVILFKFSFWISGLFSLGFYYFSSAFINNWLGESLTLNQNIVILIIVNLFFDIAKWPIELVKYKYAYFKDIYNPIIEVILNLSISMVLVQYYGLIGVILGTAVVNVISNFIVKPIIVFKFCLFISWYKFIKELLMSLFELVSTFFIVNYVFTSMLEINVSIYNSWGSFIKYLFLFLVIYFIVWFLVVNIFRSNYALSGLVHFIRRKNLK